MKALKLITIAIVLFLANPVHLQAQISVSLNFGTPPKWGPVGYTQARYYYLPDVQAYYDVQSSKFIYMNGGIWVHRTYLPAQYRNYDLYNGYKVVMTDYRGDRPYTHYNEYKVKYGKGYRGQPQRSIGQRPGQGNSHENMNSRGNQGREEMQKNNQDNGRRNDESVGRDNDNKKENNHGNGGGKGKNK